MKTALIEIHYLPSIEYFCALLPCSEIMLERHEFYVKQTYRNRCYINTAQGKEMLTLPLTAKHGKVLTTDIRIDYDQKWLNNHWRTLQSAYGKAPFFEHYAEDLHSILFKKYEFLYELNYHLLSLCLKWLKSDKQIIESLSYEKVPMSGVVDLRNEINAKNHEISNKYLKPVEYHQVFGNKFVTGLSLVDLIFCTGPQAGHIIKASVRNE